MVSPLSLQCGVSQWNSSTRRLPQLLLLATLCSWPPHWSAAAADVAAGRASAPAGSEDRSPHCGDWAAMGECERNPAYMLQDCAPSCAKRFLAGLAHDATNLGGPTDGLPGGIATRTTATSTVREATRQSKIQGTDHVISVVNLATKTPATDYAGVSQAFAIAQATALRDAAAASEAARLAAAQTSTTTSKPLAGSGESFDIAENSTPNDRAIALVVNHSSSLLASTTLPKNCPTECMQGLERTITDVRADKFNELDKSHRDELENAIIRLERLHNEEKELAAFKLSRCENELAKQRDRAVAAERRVRALADELAKEEAARTQLQSLFDQAAAASAAATTANELRLKRLQNDLETAESYYFPEEVSVDHLSGDFFSGRSGAAQTTWTEREEPHDFDVNASVPTTTAVACHLTADDSAEGTIDARDRDDNATQVNSLGFATSPESWLDALSPINDVVVLRLRLCLCARLAGAEDARASVEGSCVANATLQSTVWLFSLIAVVIWRLAWALAARKIFTCCAIVVLWVLGCAHRLLGVRPPWEWQSTAVALEMAQKQQHQQQHQHVHLHQHQQQPLLSPVSRLASACVDEAAAHAAAAAAAPVDALAMAAAAGSLHREEFINTRREEDFADALAEVNAVDRKRLVTASDDTASFCDAVSSDAAPILEGHSREVNALDRQRLAAASDDTASFCDAVSSAAIPILEGHSREVNALDTQRVAAASVNTASFCGAVSSAATPILEGHSRQVRAPDGKRFATAGDDTAFFRATVSSTATPILECHSREMAASRKTNLDPERLPFLEKRELFEVASPTNAPYMPCTPALSASSAADSAAPSGSALESTGAASRVAEDLGMQPP